jgi:predicted AlkP superfamily phosphohydrolase/phosphomutase
MAPPSLTVIGLDSATFDVLDPMLDAGELPNLRALLDRGASGVLRSTTHPLTPHAWSTMVTGVNAARHGIWDFTERDDTGYGLRLINGSYRRAPAVWERLAAAGRRCGVVNVPFTWPAPELDGGFVVAGMDAAFREHGMTSPDPLFGELRERLGPLELDHRYPVSGGRLDLDLVRRAAEQKVEATLWLSERFEPELLWVVFMAADHVQHLGWREWEEKGLDSAVAGTYRILDEAVGRLVEHAGGNDVVVLSDHGAGRLDGVVNLNAWLAREGFLTYVPATSRMGGKLFETAFQLRKKLPRGLRYAVKQRAGGLRERVYQQRTGFTAIDWAQTRAFAYGMFGNVVVNLRGRERDGIVEPGEEYETVRSEIAARAMDLRDPQGAPIVAAVHRREDLFDGPQIEKVPDLLIEFADYAWLGKGNVKKRAEELWDRIEIDPGSEHVYVGSHRHEGVFVVAGPSAASAPRTLAEIQDVAPTVMYLLGEPLPSAFEGRLLEETLDPGLLDARPPEFADAPLEPAGVQEASYSESEAGEVEERLRGLGYLE